LGFVCFLFGVKDGLLISFHIGSSKHRNNSRDIDYKRALGGDSGSSDLSLMMVPGSLEKLTAIRQQS
jgi:hypothetical protein